MGTTYNYSEKQKQEFQNTESLDTYLKWHL